jgi:hypothetical protein
MPSNEHTGYPSDLHCVEMQAHCKHTKQEEHEKLPVVQC